MKGKRKKVQHFFVYIAMLVMSGFLIMGGLQQLSMTHELKSSIVQKEKEKNVPDIAEPLLPTKIPDQT